VTEAIAPASRVAASDPLARIVQPTVRSAARRVAATWSVATLDTTEQAALEELALVARAVAREEEIALALPTTVVSGVLRRRLLDLLRAATVEIWTDAEPPETAELLALSSSFERVREALEPQWDQRFTAYLSAPTGFDLVVEVAHDLRSPLTSILFLSELLQRGQSGEINELQRRQLGIIYSAALGLISVASDLIEFARGGDQLIDRDPVPFSVVETFDSVRNIVQALAEEKGLALRLLPPLHEVRAGHPVALSRVLLNLTTNALKFTDEGMVELTARELGPTRIEFSVRDTGRGIDQEVLDSLYQPFRPSRSRKQYHFSGSGLGLVITRRLVEAMGSRLEYETRPGWGTRFFFELDLPPIVAPPPQ
jgi:signal transduction histidine kinase